MKLMIIPAAILVLAGCAAPRPVTFHKDGAEPGEQRQAMAQCDYETSAATQGTDYTFRSSFGQEFDRATRKRELMLKCMAARGWYIQR